MSVPSMTMSTIAAIATPAISPGPTICGTVAAISDEKSTVTPSIGVSVKWSMTATLTSSGSSRRGTVKSTLTRAVLPSSETVRMPDAMSSSSWPSASCSAC